MKSSNRVTTRKEHAGHLHDSLLSAQITRTKCRNGNLTRSKRKTHVVTSTGGLQQQHNDRHRLRGLHEQLIQ